MTKDETMTKPEARKAVRCIRHSPAAPKLREGGLFDHSFVIRHSSFVIFAWRMFVIRKSAIRNSMNDLRYAIRALRLAKRYGK
jgi:hypothetical protein